MAPLVELRKRLSLSCPKWDETRDAADALTTGVNLVSKSPQKGSYVDPNPTRNRAGGKRAVHLIATALVTPLLVPPWNSPLAARQRRHPDDAIGRAQNNLRDCAVT